MNELLAFEIKSPSTSAEAVPTTAVERDQAFGLVGSVVRRQAPAEGPASKRAGQYHCEDGKPDDRQILHNGPSSKGLLD
jgi:hypothetical protein